MFNRNSIAVSSEYYYILASELKALQRSDPLFSSDGDPVLLLGKKHTIAGGANTLDKAKDDEFIKTKVAYYTYAPWIGFWLTLSKEIKKKFYTIDLTSYSVRFDKLMEANVVRGIRTLENAYQLNLKKWPITQEAARQEYLELYNSIKTNGYDPKWPMFVMLNRKLGVKDQVFQGHHRIGICRELGIERVNIAFWTAPASFKFMHLFVRRKKI